MPRRTVSARRGLALGRRGGVKGATGGSCRSSADKLTVDKHPCSGRQELATSSGRRCTDATSQRTRRLQHQTTPLSTRSTSRSPQPPTTMPPRRPSSRLLLALGTHPAQCCSRSATRRRSACPCCGSRRTRAVRPLLSRLVRHALSLAALLVSGSWCSPEPRRSAPLDAVPRVGCARRRVCRRRRWDGAVPLTGGPPSDWAAELVPSSLRDGGHGARGAQGRGQGQRRGT